MLNFQLWDWRTYIWLFAEPFFFFSIRVAVSYRGHLDLWLISDAATRAVVRTSPFALNGITRMISSRAMEGISHSNHLDSLERVWHRHSMSSTRLMKDKWVPWRARWQLKDRLLFAFRPQWGVLCRPSWYVVMIFPFFLFPGLRPICSQGAPVTAIQQHAEAPTSRKS